MFACRRRISLFVEGLLSPSPPKPQDFFFVKPLFTPTLAPWTTVRPIGQRTAVALDPERHNHRISGLWGLEFLEFLRLIRCLER